MSLPVSHVINIEIDFSAAPKELTLQDLRDRLENRFMKFVGTKMNSFGAWRIKCALIFELEEIEREYQRKFRRWLKEGMRSYVLPK